MDCPRCGKGCIKPAEDLISKLDSLYIACPDCARDPNLDKRAPFKDLKLGEMSCKSCGRSPLDAVMLGILRVLVEHGLRDRGDTLRSAGTPLVEVGYPLAYPPRLGKRELVIAGDKITREAAEEILDRVPEVKGVIAARGVPGVTDSRSGPNTWELLAGCDIRADIVQSLFGELAIYKSQSKIHIEFPRQNSPKIKVLESLYFQGKLRDVVDGLCGPGTLGLTCVLAGAKRVVLNDIWLYAVENAITNLEANRSILEIDKIERLEEPKGILGSDPVLVAKATGRCEIEVYHGDLQDLFSRAMPGQTCLIDHFPGSRIDDLRKACRGCKEIIII